jgi:hypothetical protein
MRSRVRSVAFGVAVASLAAAAVVACSDDGAQSRAYDVPDGAPPPANLPEAAAEAEAPPANDAGDERPPFDPADEPVTCAGAGAPCVVQLVAGGNHFCARLEDGTVRCWGDDAFGALGGGDPNAGPKEPKGDDDAGDDADADAGVDAGPEAGPTNTITVAGLDHVTQLSASNATTCARVDDGSVLCWGSNDSGQLGLSPDRAGTDQDPHPVASPVALPEPAVRVDVGGNSACATLASGDIWCWGNDEEGKLARPGTPTQFVIVPGPASFGHLSFTGLLLGDTTFLGCTATGDVVSWGALSGGDGLLSGRVSSISPDPTPYPIAQLHGATSASASTSLFKGQGFAPGFIETGIIPGGGSSGAHAHACAVIGGEVSCWGRSDVGALCTGFADPEVLPAHAPIESKAWAQQVAVGDEITCARMTDGTVQCCGDDTAGRLGTEKVSLYSTLFVPADAFKSHAVEVAASNHAVCALVQGGTVECWGGNAHGELGMSAPDDAAHPAASKVAF